MFFIVIDAIYGLLGGMVALWYHYGVVSSTKPNNGIVYDGKSRRATCHKLARDQQI